MFERFTERARQVVVLAQAEARTLKHNYIGTEHLLLGVLREEEGVGARVLDTFDITVEEVRAQIARIIGQGDEVATGEIPFTPRAKKALELALNEALSLGHNYIDTAHILLGLVRENEGVGARILRDFGADAEMIHAEIIRMLSGPSRRGGVPSRATQRSQEAAELIVACLACGTPIETITTDRPNTSFQISAEGDRTCAGCGKQWTIAYTVSWKERSAGETGGV